MTEVEPKLTRLQVTSRVADAARLYDQSRRLQVIFTNQVLNSIPRAKYAGFDCDRPDKPTNCFEGTRTDILAKIKSWALDKNAKIEPIFWVSGIAGVGKTTVARTIAEWAQDSQLLGGQFFFSRRVEAKLRDPALVFTTIAYQLARFDPEYRQCIIKALMADPDAPYTSRKEQLERLIIRPLQGFPKDSERVVVLIFDAFNECESQGAKEILRLLIASISRLPFLLKILITSRDEPHIRSILLPSDKTRITALHDIAASIVTSDIEKYLRAKLRGLADEEGRKLPQDWVTDEEIRTLAKKAGNLFIHAATSVRFLADSIHLRRRLDFLLQIGSSTGHDLNGDNPFVELDNLYSEIVGDLIKQTNAKEVELTFQPIIGSIVLLRDPLPADALERLIGLGEGTTSDILTHLRSVILPGNSPDYRPLVYHPSFPDFLQDEKRCTDKRFRIDTAAHEKRMALHCLDLIDAELNKKMLGDLDLSLLNSEVEDLEARIRKAFSPELQYACRYWAVHLMSARGGDTEIVNGLERFAAKGMLPWIEAMSWLGDARLCLTCLEALNAWVVSL